MKKTLFAIAAMVAMVACNNDYVVKETAQEAIGFDNMFVDNSTRSVNDPSFTNGNLFANFGVFGTVEGAELFDNKTVAGSGINGTWTYEGTQYWIAGAKYNFAAVAPQSVDGNLVYSDAEYNVVKNDGVYTGTTTLSFVNNGTTDLLYAEATAEGKAEQNDPVAFTFRHTLSKVKFSFENAYNASNATIKVRDVMIKDAYANGNVVLTAAASTWTPVADSNNLTLEFGNAVADGTKATDANAIDADAFGYGKTQESYYELFMIPGAGQDVTVTNADSTEITHDDVYTVQFTVELLVSGEKISDYVHTIYTTFAPEAGKSYDLKAVINPENIDPEHSQEAIVFTVTKISDWDNGNTHDSNDDDDINDYYPIQ